MSQEWVYVRSEPQLFTVGFFDPRGRWHSDSDHGSREEAAARAAYLNGAADQPTAARRFHVDNNGPGGLRLVLTALRDGVLTVDQAMEQFVDERAADQTSAPR